MSSDNENFAAEHVSTSTATLRIDGVGIWNLTVMIYQEGDFWIAQGLEIDHVTQGKSVAEVKQRFQEAFTASLNEHLRKYHDISRFVVTPPSEVLLDMDVRSERPVQYSHVSLHIETLQKTAKLNFLQQIPEKAAA
jgi:predicted RNase H-like HicB family nuclease